MVDLKNNVSKSYNEQTGFNTGILKISDNIILAETNINDTEEKMKQKNLKLKNFKFY